jgi:hypothetical protein
MTQITPELLNAVMAKQGAPNTTDNLNRIAEFAAVHPGILEQYIGKGTDASQVGNSITDSIAATDGAAPRGLADPNGYLSTVDPATGTSNIAPRLTKTPESTGARTGGGGARKPAGIPGDFNAPVGAPPFPKPTAAAPGDDGLGVPWWLLPFAARKIAKPGDPNLPPPFVQEPRGGLPTHLQQPGAENAGRVRPGGGVTDVNDLNAQRIGQSDPRASGYFPRNQQALPAPGAQPPDAPQVSGPPQRPVLPSSDVPTYPSNAPQITKEGIYDATAPGVQAQIDAENAQARALQEQIAAQERARASTSETLKAGAQSQRGTPRTTRPARPGIR